MDDSHGNKTHSGGPRPHIDVRKVPVDSVPYGDSISRNGRTVWATYDDEGHLVAVAATAPEARRKYREAVRRKHSPDVRLQEGEKC